MGQGQCGIGAAATTGDGVGTGVGVEPAGVRATNINETRMLIMANQISLGLDRQFNWLHL